MENISFLTQVAYNLRVNSLVQAAHAQSGHPTTCLSAADIVAVLFFNIMQYDPDNFENPDNDRFILSKGHASALLYAVWKELGKLSQEELQTYRQFTSVLEGHPTLRFKYTEAATGALGTGICIAVGEAIAAGIEQRSFYTYVLLGDAECAEGAVWEAAQVAAHYKLDHLIAIVDCNRLGQSEETLYGHDINKFEKLFAAFGWEVLTVDGHSLEDLLNVFAQAKKRKGKPIVILAKTIKGYPIDFAQDKLGFHGKAFIGAQLEEALAQLSRATGLAYAPIAYQFVPSAVQKTASSLNSGPLPSFVAYEYTPKERIATRYAFGKALAAAGARNEKIVVLDADVKNSTYTELFEQQFPNRFVQCFVAEQNMVGMAIGLARRGLIPFAATFAAFFTRAHDHIRMAAIGQAPLRLVGSHAGVAIGQDGPSQMGLEDIALMRCLPESIVLYPADGTSTQTLVQEMINYKNGISYLRTTRQETPVIYTDSSRFKIGGSMVLRNYSDAVACVVSAGITLFEALKAADLLQSTGVTLNVIDCYSIKPIDTQTIAQIAARSNNRIIVVEDHYAQGGIAEAVRSALVGSAISITSLCVRELPRSGKPEELLAWARIDANAIIATVQDLLRSY